MPTTRKVALIIEATNAYARGLLHGVARYTHEHARWTTYFEPHALDEAPPRWLKGWNGDGILARIGSRRMAKAVELFRKYVPGCEKAFMARLATAAAFRSGVLRTSGPGVLRGGLLHPISVPDPFNGLRQTPERVFRRNCRVGSNRRPVRLIRRVSGFGYGIRAVGCLAGGTS